MRHNLTYSTIITQTFIQQSTLTLPSLQHHVLYIFIHIFTANCAWGIISFGLVKHEINHISTNN